MQFLEISSIPQKSGSDGISSLEQLLVDEKSLPTL